MKRLLIILAITILGFMSCTNDSENHAKETAVENDKSKQDKYLEPQIIDVRKIKVPTNG